MNLTFDIDAVFHMNVSIDTYCWRRMNASFDMSCIQTLTHVGSQVSMHQSWHTYQRVMSFTWTQLESVVSRIQTLTYIGSQVRMNQCWHTYERVTSFTWMLHSTWMRHFTRMRHLTHMNALFVKHASNDIYVSSGMNESFNTYRLTHMNSSIVMNVSFNTYHITRMNASIGMNVSHTQVQHQQHGSRNRPSHTTRFFYFPHFLNPFKLWTPKKITLSPTFSVRVQVRLEWWAYKNRAFSHNMYARLYLSESLDVKRIQTET